MSGSNKAFLVFDSEDRCVALNREKVAACHFLFDLAVPEEGKEDEKLEINVHLISAKEPLKFDVEPDDREPEKDDEGFRSQLQSLIFFLIQRMRTRSFGLTM